MTKITGKVIMNSVGQKAISFSDVDWAALPIGAEIYAELPPLYCECPPGTDRCITQGGHFPACTACKRRLKP